MNNTDTTDTDNTNGVVVDPELTELKCKIIKIVKEALHNDFMYPELAQISTYRELTAWIRKHYRLFYSVFQTDLLCVLASIPKQPNHHL